MQLSLLTVLIAGISIPVFLPFNAASSSTCYRDDGLTRGRRLEAVKQEILLRLGLDAEPSNPSNTTNITNPGFLEELKMVQKAQDLNYVHKPCASLDFRTKEILLFHPSDLKKNTPKTRTAFGDECASNTSVHFYNTYKFKFHVDLREKDFITDAQLRLKKSLLDSSTLPQNRVVQKDRIDIYFIARPENYYGEELRRFVKSALLDPDDINGLAIFNVTDAIFWWLEIPEHAITHYGEIEFEVGIRCPQPLTEGINFIPNFQFFSGSSVARDSQLVITTYKDKNSSGEGGQSENGRRKRKREVKTVDSPTGPVFCNPNQFTCCLTELRINFQRDFNWTWVIRPLEIAFNYCSGACAVRFGLINQHSQFLDIYRRAQNNPAAAAEPCCVPNSYSSVALGISIAEVQSIKLLDDIIATSCACR